MVHRQIITKRNRVYSLESNKLLRISFARKYVNYLEPALKKINENSSPSSIIKQNGGNDIDELNHIEKLVRFEVDMAMAVSAKEFAWSRSLEAQLQLRNMHNINNVGGFQQHDHLAIVDQEKVSESLLGTSTFSPQYGSNAMLPLMHISKKYYSNSMSKATSSRRKVQVQEAKNGNEEEERIIKNGLRQLRMVLPGGKEMGDDIELLNEIASYITCLQLQVNILQCLVEN